MSHEKESPGQTQDKIERLYLSAGLGTPQCSPGYAGGSGWLEGGLGFSAWTAAPVTRDQVNRGKWMDV